MHTGIHICIGFLPYNNTHMLGVLCCYQCHNFLGIKGCFGTSAYQTPRHIYVKICNRNGGSIGIRGSMENFWAHWSGIWTNKSRKVASDIGGTIWRVTAQK